MASLPWIVPIIFLFPLVYPEFQLTRLLNPPSPDLAQKIDESLKETGDSTPEVLYYYMSVLLFPSSLFFVITWSTLVACHSCSRFLLLRSLLRRRVSSSARDRSHAYFIVSLSVESKNLSSALLSRQLHVRAPCATIFLQHIHKPGRVLGLKLASTFTVFWSLYLHSFIRRLSIQSWLVT